MGLLPFLLTLALLPDRVTRLSDFDVIDRVTRLYVIERVTRASGSRVMIADLLLELGVFGNVDCRAKLPQRGDC